MQSSPSSHRAAGLWLATALPLTAERAVSAMGFERGNEGFKTRREQPACIFDLSKLFGVRKCLVTSSTTASSLSRSNR